MKVEIIRQIAAAMDIKVGKMKKAELVKVIQVAEGNVPLFRYRRRWCLRPG